MNRLLASLLLCVFLSSAALAAANPAPTDDLAQRLTATSVRQELAENDPRVAQTRKLLDKAVKVSREEPVAIAAACSRYAGHLFDSIHVSATALELLEALATFGKAGKPISETLQGYVAARKAAPARSHVEAMAALGGKK